ncbi:MAG: hypothetical protein ACE5MH_07680 [Terriglobia bacterium]
MQGPEKIARSLLLLAGMLMTIPSATYAQADPATPRPVSGRAVALEEILPADVLARVELLRDELELIRFEMGRPKDERSEIGVTHVIPRQVVFQAMTLFRKANQLHFELTGDVATELPIQLPMRLPPDIRPFHVWLVVDAAYQRILTVKRTVGITAHIEETAQEPSIRPTAAFRAIVQANRQFDWLLERQPTTRDVFHQVALATHFTARLLEQFPGVTARPAAPAFEHGKRPVDVYNRLLECYARIRAIAERSGIAALKFVGPKPDASMDELAQVDPSDVYDIAILIVSELAYLHAQLKHTEPPLEEYEPGLKLPAHVYQRAGLLLRQLTNLETRVAANPNWQTSIPRFEPQR